MGIFQKGVFDLFNDIATVSMWGVMPMLFLFTEILAIIVCICSRSDKTIPIKEIENSRKYSRARYIYGEPNKLFIGYILACIIWTMTILLAKINVREEAFINGMILNIETFSSISIGLTAIITTITVVIVAFDKKYYLTFTTKDVLKKYHFIGTIYIVPISCIIICIMTLSLLDNKINSTLDVIKFMILEEAMLFNFFSVSYSFFIIIKVIFSSKVKEFKLLKQLHRVFWIYNIDMRHVKNSEEWKEESIFLNIEYLVGRYVKYYKRIKASQIKKIEFSTSIGIYEEKWFKKGKKKYIIFTTFILLLSVIVDLCVLKKNSIIIISLNLVCYAVIFLLSTRQKRSIRIVIINWFLDTWGYYVKWQNGKEKFVPRVALRKNRNIDNYFYSLNDLLAFFYLAALKKVNKKKCKYAIDITINMLDKVEEKNMITYMPIFILGFFFFCIDRREKSIKELFINLHLDNKQRYDFFAMIDSQIFYLMNNDFNCREWKNKRVDYQKWLSN